MRYITPFLFAVLSSPAWAASGPFVSLKNTNFIVLLSFILFIAVLIYLKVPAMMGKLLDQRAEGIQADLDEKPSCPALEDRKVFGLLDDERLTSRCGFTLPTTMNDRLRTGAS
jgi:hypothetical protein